MLSLIHIFACAFALFNIGTIYYLKYSLGLGNRYSSYMYVLSIVIFIIMTPIAGKMALRYGKANQQMVTMAISAVIGFGAVSYTHLEYIVQMAEGNIPAWSIPVIIFIIGALMSFSTGTSWGRCV